VALRTSELRDAFEREHRALESLHAARRRLVDILTRADARAPPRRDPKQDRPSGDRSRAMAARPRAFASSDGAHPLTVGDLGRLAHACRLRHRASRARPAAQRVSVPLRGGPAPHRRRAQAHHRRRQTGSKPEPSQLDDVAQLAPRLAVGSPSLVPFVPDEVADVDDEIARLIRRVAGPDARPTLADFEQAARFRPSPPSFAVLRRAGLVLVVAPRDMDLVSRAVQFAVRLASIRGPASVANLAFSVAAPKAEIVARAVSAHTGFLWLDRGAGWFWIRPPRCRLLGVIRRLLRQQGPTRLEDLAATLAPGGRAREARTERHPIQTSVTPTSAPAPAAGVPRSRPIRTPGAGRGQGRGACRR
jgi:hypothetical protein